MTIARTAGRRVSFAIAAALLLLAPAGCSSWLDVKTPDIIAPGSVSNSDGAIAAYDGAIGDFNFADDGDNGGTEGQILVSGVTADEYFDAETFPTRIEYDSRNITEQNVTLTTVFFNWSKARVSAEQAAAALEQFAPTPTSRVAEMFALAGFTYVGFAEHYCSGVPFDERAPSGAIQFGTPLSTNQILDVAIARFDSALAYASPGSEIYYLAAVGKGRALVDKGSFAAADAAVTGVPTNFTYRSFHDQTTNRQWNGVFVFNNAPPTGTQRFSVSDTEGTAGLNFRSAGDPRVVAPQHGLGFDKLTPLYVLTKYASPASPVVVAGGVEARLISAEAQLAVGNGAGMVTSLNTLRADSVHNGGFNLTAVADPGTAAGQADLLFRERAFWLFGTGHRLGDLRRLVRQYARAINSVYPNGAYFKGSTFGTSTELPVPFAERNNPLFTGCDATTP
jgi:hypothetical protein